MVIHGGSAFGTREEYLDFLRKYPIDIERYKTEKDDWKPWLREALGPGYEIILPVMPNKTNARYEEWKIWMDKLLPYLNDGVVLVGHSLGGSFLAKYLSENIFPKKIAAAMLVAALFDTDDHGNGLETFALPAKLNFQTDHVYLYHSTDDSVVPFRNFESFAKSLPTSQSRVFNDRGHLNQETFPELVEDIKSLN